MAAILYVTCIGVDRWARNTTEIGSTTVLIRQVPVASMASLEVAPLRYGMYEACFDAVSGSSLSEECSRIEFEDCKISIPTSKKEVAGHICVRSHMSYQGYRTLFGVDSVKLADIGFAVDDCDTFNTVRFFVIFSTIFIGLTLLVGICADQPKNAGFVALVGSKWRTYGLAYLPCIVLPVCLPSLVLVCVALVSPTLPDAAVSCVPLYCLHGPVIAKTISLTVQQ